MQQNKLILKIFSIFCKIYIFWNIDFPKSSFQNSFHQFSPEKLRKNTFLAPEKFAPVEILIMLTIKNYGKKLVILKTLLGLFL